MDRVQNYDLQTPLTADDLNKERDFTAIALGKIISALLGQGTVVSELGATAVASTTVPTVQLADGQLYELATLDPTAFGSLSATTFPSTATVMKQGLLLASRGDANTFQITPPGTSGESIIYLLEAQYADLDTDVQTITFYNTTNPENPTTSSEPRVREGTIAFVLKAGIASSSPTAPSADAGYVPLYNIEVAYGQTVLSQSNITVASGAPFLSQKLFNLMNGGSITIPNATANNEPVALGQFIPANGAISSINGTATSLSLTTPVFTAPSNGYFMVTATAAYTTSGGTFTLSASLGALTSIGEVYSEPFGVFQGQLKVLSGQQSSFTFSMSFPTSNAMDIAITVFFVPTL